MCLFSHSIGKSVGETKKLWGSLNETKQEIREIQAKKNKRVAGGNTSLDEDSTTGNPVSFSNSTNERLKRLENESRGLIEDFKIIEKAAKNLSRTELKVRACINQTQAKNNKARRFLVQEKELEHCEERLKLLQVCLTVLTSQ